ncbi:hypothetical protein IFM47457_04505 [Aspergillus lentulus]|nr:hypothetical protein IFM47457_04505 [Aspergillus lentulus]
MKRLMKQAGGQTGVGGKKQKGWTTESNIKARHDDFRVATSAHQLIYFSRFIYASRDDQDAVEVPCKAGPDSSSSHDNGPKKLQKASDIPPSITVPHKDARNERCRHDDGSAFKRLAIPEMGSEMLSKESNIVSRDYMTARIPAPKLSGRRHQHLAHPDRWKEG